MNERREHQRIDGAGEATLTIEGRSFRCSIQNISAGGALVRFERANGTGVSLSDIGKEVTLVVTANGQDPTGYDGRLIRLLDEGPVIYIAIFFLVF